MSVTPKGNEPKKTSASHVDDANSYQNKHKASQSLVPATNT